ncbi:MAG TPA: FAD-dependent monooxygenase [Candidatus Binataceae bacterium]|nr:FAD-dependent monooxygenase [Candidatus Binataceae bacterium]
MPAPSATDQVKPLDALVIGGSMAGLCAGLVLRDVGCAVEIFEKSSREMQARGAGLVVQDDVLDFVTRHCGAVADQLGVRSYARQLLARDGSVMWTQASPQLMTSWDSLYRCLKNAFPEEHYHHGTRLAGIRQDADRVYAGLEGGGEQACDLLVCADGANSTARRLLLPDINAVYAGYVAWRGMVKEGDVDGWVRDFLAEKFTFFLDQGIQILCYFVPGPAGETVTGQRRINWVWYWNVAEGEELRATLTDRTGLFHDYSVPQGAIEPALLKRQREVAARVLPEILQHLFDATPDPFIQPIYDLSVPKMVFDRVCLLGDAAFVPRPHPAASTHKAFSNAITLGHSLRAHSRDVVAALREWEPAQMELGERLARLGQEVGNRSQFGNVKGPGVLEAVARGMGPRSSPP